MSEDPLTKDPDALSFRAPQQDVDDEYQQLLDHQELIDDPNGIIPENLDELRPSVPRDNASSVEQAVYETAYKAAQSMFENKQLKAENAEIAAQNERDPKTGLLTSEAFRAHAKAKIEGTNRISEANKSHLFVIFDIDDFKALNDIVGYQDADDQFLKPAAQKILRTIRSESDLAGRFGGEEMMVLLDGVTEENAQEVLHKLRGEINSISYNNIQLGISAGAVLIPQGTKYETAFDECNRLLHEAKMQEGKNQTLFNNMTAMV